VKTYSILKAVCAPLLILTAALRLSPAVSGATLDYGVDPANLGKGEWVYVVSDAINHLQDQGYSSCYVASVVDLSTLMAYFKTNLHLQYLVVKAGTGSTNYPATNPQFTTNLVTAAHAQGLKIFGYTMTYGTDIPGELAIVTNCFNAGADGFVLDAEDHLIDQGLAAGTAAAWNLAGQFKTNWPTRFLGASIIADIYLRWGAPGNFPHKELGYWCDAVMPQAYWRSWSQSTSATARQYGTPIKAIQWTDSNFSQYHTWLASQGATPPTFKDPTGAPWTRAIKPLVMIGEADVPGVTNQTCADMTNFVCYLKTDPTCVTTGGYKGCCFFRPGRQDTTDMLPGIAALSIGEPTITNQPASRTNLLNTSAAFGVGAGGAGALSYQWNRNGNPLSDSGQIAGASTATLTLAAVQPADAGSFSVIVSNFCGTVTSQVATLTVRVPPSITTQPANANVPLGGTAGFSVSVTGDPPLHYQWQFNGANLAGAAASSLNLFPIQSSNAGYYQVVVTNTWGAATSTPALLALLVTNADGSLAVPPNGQNWWPAENNAHDELGGNDGTAQSGVSYTVGKCGQAFAFDGTTNALIAVGAPEMPPPWSASFWVKSQVAPGAGGALLGDTNFVLKLSQAGSDDTVGLTQVNVADYSFGYVVPSNTWTHLVFVGTLTNTSLYVNGVFQGSTTQSCALPRTYLGGWVTPSGRTVDNLLGALDEIALFNRVLSPEEISALSTAGAAGMWRIPTFHFSPTADRAALVWTLQGLSGKSFTVYGSSNLSTWQTLFTLPGPYGFIQFTDTPAAAQRFYRATQP
jgi:hypothetical protein